MALLIGSPLVMWYLTLFILKTFVEFWKFMRIWMSCRIRKLLFRCLGMDWLLMKMTLVGQTIQTKRPEPSESPKWKWLANKKKSIYVCIYIYILNSASHFPWAKKTLVCRVQQPSRNWFSPSDFPADLGDLLKGSTTRIRTAEKTKDSQCSFWRFFLRRFPKLKTPKVKVEWNERDDPEGSQRKHIVDANVRIVHKTSCLSYHGKLKWCLMFARPIQKKKNRNIHFA